MSEHGFLSSIPGRWPIIVTTPTLLDYSKIGAEKSKVGTMMTGLIQYHRIVKEKLFTLDSLNITQFISPDQTSVTLPRITGVHLKRDALFLLISQRHNTRLHWRMLLDLG